MKKLLVWLTALMLACGMLPAIADGNTLGLEILARRYDGEHNQIISPVSLNYALAMALEGAKGETKAELEEALAHVDMSTFNMPLAEAGLKWANAAFAREDLPLHEDYADALKARFAAELFPLDDASRVNAWVDEHTDHLIDKLVDDIDPDIRFMLINAIAMDAKWAHPFAFEDTWADTFHAPSGDVEADFMHDTFFMAYGENDSAQYIRLDYRDSGLYMLIALPRGDDLSAVLDGIAKGGLDWFKDMAPREVALTLPKLDISASNMLSGDLMALGIKKAFTDDAEFPGISQQPLKISDVLQKARVQLDEEGTRAAAVTAMMMEAAGCAPDEEPPTPFIADRPFAMLIAEETTGAVCFAGAVCDPS